MAKSGPKFITITGAWALLNFLNLPRWKTLQKKQTLLNPIKKMLEKENKTRAKVFLRKCEAFFEDNFSIKDFWKPILQNTGELM